MYCAIIYYSARLVWQVVYQTDTKLATKHIYPLYTYTEYRRLFACGESRRTPANPRAHSHLNNLHSKLRHARRNCHGYATWEFQGDSHLAGRTAPMPITSASATPMVVRRAARYFFDEKRTVKLSYEIQCRAERGVLTECVRLPMRQHYWFYRFLLHAVTIKINGSCPTSLSLCSGQDIL